jgi:glycosyltransferase involved in cell wall biosynthesis
MNVLFVHNFYQQFGGEDAAYLADKRLMEERGTGAFSVSTYERHNDEIRGFSLSDRARFPIDTISSRKTARDIANLARRERIDVAYIHNVYPLISPSIFFALHDAGVRIVQMVHDFRFLCPNGWFFTGGAVCERCKAGNTLHAIVHRCYRNSYSLSAVYAASVARARSQGIFDTVSLFVCPTPFMAGKLIEAGVPPTRTRIKPHFMDIPPPDAARAGDYALYLGRLSPEKGVRTLLRAWRELKDVPLRVAGTGPLDQELRAYKADHGLGQVLFEGFVSGEAKRELLRNARLVIVPSECYETFGMTVLEAYAAARPVIASRIGSLPYVVEDSGSGALVPPASPEELAATIRRLFHDTQACGRMGERGRTLLETAYGPAANFRILADIFQEAACGR